MSKLIQLLHMGPVIIGEFRGGKAETFRRFDKTDKNAPPIVLGMYKFNIEQLADGAPVLVAVFLDNGISAEDFATTVLIKRGDIVIVAVNKLEMKNGVRRASCGQANFFVLEKSEVDQLRGGSKA
jgi:hypothetical protein